MYRWNVEVSKKQQLQEQLKATASTYIASAADDHDADDDDDADADADDNADDADAVDDKAPVLTLPNDVDADVGYTETTEFGVACEALPTADNKKGPLSFFLYIAYADMPTDFVKLGCCQDGVERTESLPNLTDISARHKYTNLMSRYREVQRQVPVGPGGLMHFEIYQPSDSVHAWLNATDSIKNFCLSITGVEAALRCFLVTRHDGSSLLEQWAPTFSSSAAKSSPTSDAKLTELEKPQEEQEQSKWTELGEPQEQEQDGLLRAIHVPNSLPTYDLTEDMSNFQKCIASDQKCVERRFLKSISKQELLPRKGNMREGDYEDVKDLVGNYRLKCQFFNLLAVDHPLFQAYYKL